MAAIEHSRATVADRVRDYELALRARPAPRNPYMADAWPGAKHWRCTLHCQDRSMRVFFSQGAAFTKPPTVEDVVNALAMDAAEYENARDLAEWCREYGHTCSEAKARTRYRHVKELTEKFKALIEPLGPCAWENLLYHTEAL